MSHFVAFCRILLHCDLQMIYKFNPQKSKTMKVRLSQDTRGTSGKFAIRVAINNLRSTGYIHTDIAVTQEQWDKKLEMVVNHPSSTRYNATLLQKKLKIEQIAMEIVEQDGARFSGVDLKDMVMNILEPKPEVTFVAHFEKFLDRKDGGTKEIYQQTLKRIRAFDKFADRLTFEEVNVSWLKRFEDFMAKTSPSKNARNVHLRNIRAVFNDALDEEVTSFYPFRRFKIRPVATPKRSLSVEELRELINFPLEEHQVVYRDMFMLIFYLIGINIIDLMGLKKMVNDRIEYTRAKTKRLYSIKVEPEAMEIINKYKGEKYLVDLSERYSNHKTYRSWLNKNLKKLGEANVVNHKGKLERKPLQPELTSYWARHTWATIAASLDMPKETIAAALGHGGNTVTDIYIDFDQRKVDDANRRVIDWVLYGKKKL